MSTTEHILDEVLDKTPVLAPAPELESDAEIHSFVTDVAKKIHDPEVIAQRYGFPDALTMVGFIKDHPEIRRRIKVRRAIWESDDNAAERVRELARHALLEALPTTSSMMFDTTVPAGIRIDATKLHARMAGVDGIGTNNGKAEGQSGTSFNLTINLPGGRTEQITTVVDSLPKQVEQADE